MSLNIVFAGTPDFAVGCLEAVATEHHIQAVYTQPDRPAGRGRKLTASPVKKSAIHLGVDVRQPLSFKQAEDVQALADLQPDLMIVVAYGLILPQAVLDIPKYGCINVHASLLPRWRGAAPIQRAILAGDQESGVTTMQMDAGLDTGDILLIARTEIDHQCTGGKLHDTLAQLGADVLLETLQKLELDQLQPLQQNDADANYAAKLSKAEAAVNWQDSAVNITRQIRAFNPWPVAHTLLNGKPLRLWNAVPATHVDAPPGTIVHTDKTGVVVATANGAVCLTELQPAGKRPMNAGEFAHGHSLQDQILGS